MIQKTRQNNTSRQLLMGGMLRQNLGMLTIPCLNPTSAGVGMPPQPMRSRYLRRLAAVISAVIVFCLVGCQNNRPGQPTVIRTPQGYTHIPGSIPGRSRQSPRHPWLPTAYREKLNQWEGIVIHHTVTDHGPASYINRLHKDKGYDETGYHFVINNGRGERDGKVEPTSRWFKQKHGAHCRVNKNDNNYWNEHTIGIGLIGNFEKSWPTNAQYDSLARLVHFLQKRYGISINDVKGHKHIKPTKCPGKHFSFAELKRRIATIR